MKKYLSYLVLWFKLMHMLCPDENGNQTLSIVIYLTHFKKKLPIHNDSYKPHITSEHINSTFTYTCMKGETITIYREEEWFKVLLHECIHSFCLDFTENKTYTEVWAELIQCALIAYTDCGGIPTIFSLLFDFYSKVEIVHSVIQARKILSYYGYSFLDVREKKHFNQETHLFDYYILKALVMLNVDAFYVWCLENNGNNLIPMSQKQGTEPFYQFLVESCSEPQLEKADTIQKVFNESNKSNKSLITDDRNLLMSIIEM